MLQTCLTRGSCTSSWNPGGFESRAERLPVCAHGFRELIVCLASPQGHDARTVYVPAWAADSVVLGQALVADVAKTCRQGLAWDTVIKPLSRPTTSAPYAW